MNIKNTNLFQLIIYILVIFICCLYLPYPFNGDQAAFITGAKAIKQGEILYKDYWDLKQPGIYIFYYLAGSLFGYSEEGIHLFEICWILFFFIFIVRSLKYITFFQSDYTRHLLPLIFVIIYYGHSKSWHLTQPEILINFPLMLVLIILIKSINKKRNVFWYSFLSGFLTGIIAIFKLVYIILPLSFLMTIIIHQLYKHKKVTRSELVATRLTPFTFGIAVPVTIIILYFLQNNSLEYLYETTFVIPGEIIKQLELKSIKSLIGVTRWFISEFNIVISLSLLTIVILRKKLNLFTINLIVWVIIGYFLITIQTFSWWQYHFFLFVMPFSILLLKSLELIIDKFNFFNFHQTQPTRYIILVFLFLILFSPMLNEILTVGINHVKNQFTLTEAGKRNFQMAFSKDYKAIYPDVGFLVDKSAIEGDIYVCGNPIYYYLSNRRQAIAMSGWILELFTDQMWNEFFAELSNNHPVYFFIDENYIDFLKNYKQSNDQRLNNFLNRYYTESKESDNGKWYKLK